jgi:hypothetical protein
MTAMQSLIEQFADPVEQIIQIGSFQPHELVRVHHNPTDLILTNEHEHTVATTTVVLINDGQARNGLKFVPNISNLYAQKTLKLVLASTTAQTVAVEFPGYPAKQFELEANTPVLVNIGNLFGIPMIESNSGFFDLATDEGNTVVSGEWTLTNATFTTDTPSNDDTLSYTGGSYLLKGQRVTGFFAEKPYVAKQGITLEFTHTEVELLKFGVSNDNGDYAYIELSDDSAQLILSTGEKYSAAENNDIKYQLSILPYESSDLGIQIGTSEVHNILLDQQIGFPDVNFTHLWIDVRFKNPLTIFSSRLSKFQLG